MLRSTSVVITTMRAPLLMLVSPVSRPTFVGAVLGGELRVLLVAERLHRRRVEDLRARLREREVHGELGDDRLARAGRARRPARCGPPPAPRRTRAGTRRAGTRSARGTPRGAGRRRRPRAGPVPPRTARRARGVGRSCQLGLERRARRSATPRSCQQRDADGGEVQHDHRDREQDHRHHVGRRRRDRREDRDRQDRPAPALEDRARLR